ncbi:hypothetical protein V8C34DRAFT_278241 [Trichoderma compactum]
MKLQPCFRLCWHGACRFRSRSALRMQRCFGPLDLYERSRRNSFVLVASSFLLWRAVLGRQANARCYRVAPAGSCHPHEHGHGRIGMGMGMDARQTCRFAARLASDTRRDWDWLPHTSTRTYIGWGFGPCRLAHVVLV